MRKADDKIHAENNRVQPRRLYWLGLVFGKMISVFQTIKKQSNVPYTLTFGGWLKSGAGCNESW